MLHSVPNSAEMLGRYLLNSAKCGADDCRIQRMLGSVPNSAKTLGRYLLNSANAGQCAEFSE